MKLEWVHGPIQPCECFPELCWCSLLSSHLRPGHKLVSKCPSASRSCPDPDNLRAAVKKETQKNNSCYAGGVRAHNPCKIWLESFQWNLFWYVTGVHGASQTCLTVSVGLQWLMLVENLNLWSSRYFTKRSKSRGGEMQVPKWEEARCSAEIWKEIESWQQRCRSSRMNCAAQLRVSGERTELEKVWGAGGKEKAQKILMPVAELKMWAKSSCLYAVHSFATSVGAEWAQ